MNVSGTLGNNLIQVFFSQFNEFLENRNDNQKPVRQSLNVNNKNINNNDENKNHLDPNYLNVSSLSRLSEQSRNDDQVEVSRGLNKTQQQLNAVIEERSRNTI